MNYCITIKTNMPNYTKYLNKDTLLINTDDSLIINDIVFN